MREAFFTHYRQEPEEPPPSEPEGEDVDSEPLLIGPDRENFFILPYLLEEWADDRLKVRPITKAPPRISELAYEASVWFSPTFFRNATLRRQP